MVFSCVVLLSHGPVNMSGEYGVRIRCGCVNLGVFVYVWNYGTCILTIRIQDENIRTFIKLKSDIGFMFLVLDYIWFDYSFVKIRSGMMILHLFQYIFSYKPWNRGSQGNQA